MMSRWRTRATVTACAIAATLLVSSRPVALARGAVERFTAFAVDIGHPGKTFAGQVEIVVERYSTDAEAEKIMQVLLEKGPETLLETIQSMPRVGYFRTPNSIGYDIRFARKVPGEDGGEVISMMTDRYIGFWEAVNRPRTIDYPFTLIELRIGADGRGEGKMSLATKIIVEKKKNTIVLEDYKSQPVLLTNLKREATSL
jgi:hypothetical protein